MKKKILVYPSTTEIGKEIIRSFKYNNQFEIITASNESPADILLHKDLSSPEELRVELSAILGKHGIDAIYPAHDEAVYQFRDLDNLIASPPETLEICRFKSKTYESLRFKTPVPASIHNFREGEKYFAKPDNGQGSRGSLVISSKLDYLSVKDSLLISEYLPGAEYTVDCFSLNGQLIYCRARSRDKTAGGISSLTTVVKDHSEFQSIGNIIQKKLNMNYAWFFQVKENKHGILTILEVASRPSGCSGYWRMEGVNLPLLSAFSYFGFPVEIISQERLLTHMTRVSEPKYKLNYEFDNVYVDYDDTLMITKHQDTGLVEVINAKLLGILQEWQNEGKELFLVTRNPSPDMSRFPKLFMTVFIVELGADKSKFINSSKSIFIDDSFAERRLVYNKHKIPVFAPGEIEELFS